MYKLIIYQCNGYFNKKYLNFHKKNCHTETGMAVKKIIQQK